MPTPTLGNAAHILFPTGDSYVLLSNARGTPLTRARTLVVLLSFAVLASSLVALAGPADASDTRFRDLEDNVHADAIDRLAEEGVVEGCAPRRYCPGDAVTRAQAAALIVRALELAPEGSADFQDVAADHFHARAIAAAAEAGIIEGKADGSFRPGASVSRGQMASMLVRAFDLPAAKAPTFYDIEGSVHEANVRALAAARVTAGCRPGYFCTNSDVLRGQMASFLDRALRPGTGPKVPPAPPEPAPTEPAPAPTEPAPAPPSSGSTDPDSHAALLKELVGYGHRTTGGQGGQTIWVTNTNDSGAGSLRAAAQASGAKWIRFDPKVFPPGTGARIRLQSPVRPTANTTIDGRGARPIIQNHGFFINANNVIATNLVFDFAAEHRYYQGNSAFTIGWPNPGTDRVWIHKNTFLGSGPGNLDGAVDILRQANRITVSWNKFVRWDKTILLATDPTNRSEAADLVSIHHNHFDRNSQRQPLARFGRFHVWNNWFDRWDWNGSYGEAIVSSSGAQVLSERNIFDHTKPYRAIFASNEGSGRGYAKDVGSWFASGVTADTSDASRVTMNPSADHSYRPDPVGTAAERQALRDRIAAQAGWQR